MRSEILVPMIGMTMTEAKVVQWLVADGEIVREGAAILEIETDKSVLEIEAEATGRVRHGVEKGVTVAPGAVVGWLEPAGG